MGQARTDTDRRQEFGTLTHGWEPKTLTPTLSQGEREPDRGEREQAGTLTPPLSRGEREPDQGEREQAGTLTPALSRGEREQALFDGVLPWVEVKGVCAVCGKVGRVAACTFCGRETCMDGDTCMLEHLLGSADGEDICEGSREEGSTP